MLSARTFTSRRCCLSCIPLALLPFMSPVSGSTTPLETVTVVATRSEMNLDALPEAITVVSAAEIRDEQASNLGQVLENLAGVDTAGGPRSNAQSVVIRGIGGSRVLYTLDGSRQSFEGGHRGRFVIDPSLIKRVDILRGPASAQYGSGAVGGVLAVETRSASDLLDDDRQFGAIVRSAYQSAGDEVSGSITAFGELGGFDVVAQKSYRDNEDYRDGSDRRIAHTADQLDSALAKIRATLTPSQTLSLTHIETRQANRTPSNPSESISSSNPLLERANTTLSDSLGYRYRRADGVFRSLDINYYQNTTAITEDRVGVPRHDEIDFETRGGNLITRFALGTVGRLHAGVDVHRDRSEASRNGEPRPQFPDARQQVEGAFLQYQHEFGEAVSLISALRHDRYESQSRTSVARDIRDSKTTARLGGSLFATDWLTLHANYTEAYRAPNLLENYASGIHFLGNEFKPNPDLMPEEAANKELGFVIHPLGQAGDNRLRVRGNVYRNDIDNFIETRVVVEENTMNLACLGLNPPPGCVFGTISIEGSTTAVNLPRAELTGWELESRYDGEHFFADLGYARIRGESSRDQRPLLNIPADTIKLHTAWDVSGWRLGARVNHYRDQNRVPDADLNGGAVEPTPGYTLLDFYARWQPTVGWARGLTLNAGVDNVADRRYRSHLSSLNSPGRSFRLGFSYSL